MTHDKAILYQILQRWTLFHSSESKWERLNALVCGFRFAFWEQAQVIVEIYNGKFEQGWLSLLFKKKNRGE
jgi:hypothetical protein